MLRWFKRFVPHRLFQKDKDTPKPGAFKNLPRQLILCNIFTHLEVYNLASIARSCNYFARLAKDNYLWYCLFRRDYPDDVAAQYDDMKDWRKAYQNRNNKWDYFTNVLFTRGGISSYLSIFCFYAI